MFLYILFYKMMFLINKLVVPPEPRMVYQVGVCFSSLLLLVSAKLQRDVIYCH